MHERQRQATAPPPGWWTQGWVLPLIALLSAAPAIWPDVLPLVDLPGHMGRYRVQLDLAASADLQRFFRFEWALIGNLGVDLLVVALAPLLGLELAVKVIVLAIPVLTVAGFLWTAYEVHGRVPATALFAAPLAWNFPFAFGFVNFALSMALAFLAFACWLRLDRQGRERLRAVLFVFLSVVIWTVHVFGWAMLCLLAGSFALARRGTGAPSRGKALWRAALGCWPLLPPLLLMLLWRAGDVSGGTGDWFALKIKLDWFVMIFRDRWMAFDVASLVVLCALVGAAFLRLGLRFSRPLALAAVVLAIVFLLLPRILLGSAYADMRLAPYMLAVAILAIAPGEQVSPLRQHYLAVAALAFFLVRTLGTTISLADYHRDYVRELAAIDHIPRGARVAAFVGRPCRNGWTMSRLDHLPSLAIVRRNAFANDQWTMAGAQLIRVDYPAARGYAADPSQFVVPDDCRGTPWRTIDGALTGLPRAAFDHVWLIQPPPFDERRVEGLQLLWRDGASRLYRIPDRPVRPGTSEGHLRG